MPKNYETKTVGKMNEYFKLPNPNLRSYLGGVVEGQPEVYRTPWYKKGKDDRPISEILDMWMPHLEKLQDTWPGLYKFENDLAKKVGPTSVKKPLEERLPDVESYYESILLDSVPISSDAIDAVIKEWQRASGLRVRSLRRTVELMKKSTNSGSPYFAKRRDVLEDTFPCSIQVESDGTIVQKLNGNSIYKCCAILGWRGQEGGPKVEDVKQRVVWMFPMAINAEELRVYQPLIESAQRFNIVPAWVSMDAVDERITKLFDTKDPKDLIICTDFEKFDQHFNSDMSQCAATILTKIFTDTDDFRTWSKDIFPIKYNIPLCLSWNNFKTGLHGMGSGSGGTNADETLTHRALQYEAAQKAGKVLNPNSMCLGDDGIISFPGIRVEDVTSVYSSHGQVMNETKQTASTEECTYLRRWHHKDYRIDGKCAGVYSTARALGRLATQERYYDPDKWNSKMVALRQLSILENIKYHPLREEFVDFCMKGDKYRLGLDIPGFLDNIEQEAKKAIDYMPDFLGYTKSMQKEDPSKGISDWWIVKYLKSLA